MAKGVAILAIMLVVVFLIIAQGRTQASAMEGKNYANATQCAQSATCNATKTLNNAVAGIPGWVPLLIIVVVGAVVLGALKLFK